VVVVGWLKVLDGFMEKIHDVMPIGAHSIGHREVHDGPDSNRQSTT